MLADHSKPKTLRSILEHNCTPSEELLHDFENAARLMRYKKDEVVVRQGKVCSDFVINRVGLFRVSCELDAREDTLLFGTSGDIFTSLHSYYAQEPSVFSLMAVEDSEAWLVSYSDMERLMQKHPELLNWMNHLLVEQLYGLEKRYMFFYNKSAEERLNNFILKNSVSLRDKSVKHILSTVPLKYIAQYLKITQSTLSRLRAKMK